MNSKLRNNLSALALSSALLALGYLLGGPVQSVDPNGKASLLDEAALTEPAAGEVGKAVEADDALSPLRSASGPLPVLTMPYFSFAPLLPRQAGS